LFNKIILIGRVTRDFDLRYTQNGTAVAKFTLACDRPVSKDREKEADFINITVWQKLAESCANYLSKGRLVAVEGRLQIRSYDDSQGIRRKAADVIAGNVKFLDRAPDSQQKGNYQNNNSGYDGYGEEDVVSFNEEDIPF